MSMINMEYKIDVAKDFSEFPFGRYTPEDGDFTGQVFRETLLKEHIERLGEGDTLNVDFDGVKVGIGSSFLSESFGGMIKKGYIDKEKFLSVLTITCEDDLYEEEIIGYIKEAKVEVNE